MTVAVSVTMATMAVGMEAVKKYYELHGSWPTPMAQVVTHTKADGTPCTECARPLSHLSGSTVIGGDGTIRDGFDNALRFNATGSSGAPMLESAGPDGDFGDSDVNKKKVNLYSN